MDAAAFWLGGDVYQVDGIEFRRLRSVNDSVTGAEALEGEEAEPTPKQDGPPGLIAGISPFYPPGSLGNQVSIPDYLPQGGLVHLRKGSGPHVYLVHGLPGVDITQALIAPLLAPCHVCALIHDEEAWKCNSIPKLARLLCERLLQEARQAGTESEDGLVLPQLAIAGCSFGCVVAHEMALQLEEAGLDCKLVLFSLDASWPPLAPWPPTAAAPSSTDIPKRPKGCEWLGGDVEAALLAARASGATEWAQREVERSGSPESLDADDVLMRVFWEHARHFGVSFKSFNDFVIKAGRCSERLRTLISTYTPKGTFAGRTEFVMTKAAWADVPSLFGAD